jgi:RimJ/RimL family protein N-acetyltransferase
MSKASAAKFQVREAAPADAEPLIAHVRRILEEPGVCITRAPDEFTLTLEQERKFIADYALADNCVFLVAEADGEIIGLLTLRGGTRRSLRHEAELVVNVAKEWRGRGVGTALIQHSIDWAKQTGVLTRIELKVFTRNKPAVRLYEHLGFVIEGTRRKAVFKDGRYEDNHVMALLL